jgi:UDP-N-acetylmuramoyl-L-alanyl-D-glutamate--2,6-diaminopimelate ligase
MRRSMTLQRLLEGLEARVMGDAGVAVSELVYDSRAAVPGSLFFAVPGARANGLDFVGQAAHQGAVAAVLTRYLDSPALAAQVIVDDVRSLMGPVAHRFFGEPTGLLTLAGVTGTNGKTTTAHITHHLLGYRGSVGLMGTVEYRLGDRVVEASRTTPEAIDLARAFAEMVDACLWAAAMEVSSHALAQGRADGCRFDVVGFTNLSQDHLDYHGTMEDYYAAKRLLFEGERFTALRVVNADDDFGARLIDEGLADVTYGTRDGVDLKATLKEMDAQGTTVIFEGLGFDAIELRLPLVGAHNVANAACATAMCRALDVPAEIIAGRLASVPQVPGRLERIDVQAPFSVLVDYAHTPDGLAQVIPAVRAVTQGRVLTVFGCGGDRDRTKRPLMGEIAARESDVVFVTSDNPRSEEPGAIIEEVFHGVNRVPDAAVVVEADRRAAIGKALDEARPTDTVLIAGKGHEKGQEIKGVMHAFDDREVARELLAARGAGS